MTVRTLTADSGMTATWGEVTYTEVRLLGNPMAKESASVFTELRARVEEVQNQQRDVWRGMLVAHAAVHEANQALDDWVRALDRALIHLLGGNTQSRRYRLYFSSTPSTIIRMRLESQLERVRGWTYFLSSEPEPELKILAEQLGVLLAQGDAALDGRSKAEARRSDHRVRAIIPLIEDINNARLRLHGTLSQQAADLHLSRRWPDRFFQRSTRKAKSAPEPSEPPTIPAATGNAG